MSESRSAYARRVAELAVLLARREPILKSLKPILEPFALRAETSGDPRGYCLHLFAVGTRSERWPANTFGGDEAGYGV